MLTTSQVWQAITDFLQEKFPQLNVSRGYDITRYVEDLQEDDKPSLFVTLNGYTFGTVTVKRLVSEHKYDFGLTLIYKTRVGNFEENDRITDMVLPLMLEIDHQWLQGKMYFETPECTSIADSDMLDQYGVVSHTILVRVYYYTEIER